MCGGLGGRWAADHESLSANRASKEEKEIFGKNKKGFYRQVYGSCVIESVLRIEGAEYGIGKASHRRIK